VRTRVGYTGGTLKDPTYYNLGNHTESVQVDYDPTQISYEALLAVFWQAHNPETPSFSRQYMSAAFYHDEAQKQLAQETRDRVAADLGGKVETQILPAGTFYLAEDYHQKYSLRRREVFYQELEAIYPKVEDLIASTAAARLNGYLGGYGTRAQLERELDSLGLSLTAREQLLSMIRR
jgi:peptide-methionine (S)-S-oxide reductase